MEEHASQGERKGSTKTRVKVAIRVRPLLPREMVGGYRTCVSIKNDKDVLIGHEQLASSDKNGPREYKFDQAFRQDSPQGDIYEHCIKELVLSCFEGYNAAVLAYGQTGSGKTYTMGTAVSTLSDESRLGIIPRVIVQIFDQIEQRSNGSVITVTASYIELYNEQIIDLLSEAHYKKNEGITIKEDRETGLVNVEGVVKEVVATPENMLRLLEKGGMQRTTKQTNMNDMSSRSHAIFTIYIDSEPIQKEKGSKDEALTGITHSRFFFADLAGSERAKKTGATGDTFKEGVNINLGLLELGNVISALSTIQRHKDQFITFRNSKLTRILQDALGGNSNTYMIACVSPAEFNYEESVNTLKYASKAMNIKNTPVINRNKNDMLKQENLELRVETRRLKQMLAQKGVRVDFDDERPDVMEMESKIMKEENRTLTRRFNQCLVELQNTKHKLNQFEIKMYDIRREKDLIQLSFQELMRENPQLGGGEMALTLRGQFEDHQREKVQVLEKYLQQIQQLQTKLTDKDNIFGQLQSEYNSLLENSKKDEKMLIKKHKMLYSIGREHNRLKQEMARLSDGEVLRQRVVDQEVEEEVEAVMVEDEIEEDEAMQGHEEDYDEKQKATKDELSEVDRYILEKQQFLERISREQISLQTEVISSMKNEYHQKIGLLEKERRQLLKQRDESGLVEKSRFINKIDNLEGELKDYRKKAKEQRHMERQVENQSGKIKDLAQEIKRFKMQKMELHRKLKEDRDCFDKLKNKRIKEVLAAKKENMKKENEIRKIKIKTFRNEQALKKKDDELKRAKKVTEALKIFVKPTVRQSHLTRKESVQTPMQPTAQDLKHFDKLQSDFVSKICRQIHFQIDRQQSVTRVQSQLEQAQRQLLLLLNDLAGFRIKKQRIDLKADEDELSQEQISEKISLGLLIRDLQDRVEGCEGRISERQDSGLLRESIDFFDIQATVLYNKQYESVEALRSFIRTLMGALKNYIYENYQLLAQHKRDEREMDILRERVREERENLINLNAEYHRSMAHVQEDNMRRLYSEEEHEPVSAGLKRLDEREKKDMERRFQDLAKSNRQLTGELEKTRRKCEVVHEKYQSIKNLVSKDRNIGRQEEPSFIKQEKKLEKQQSNKLLLNELDGMIQNIDRLKKVKSSAAFEEVAEQVGNEGEVANRWECIWKVDAHASGVLSIAIHSNFLISTANKSIKIWDLESHKMIAELQAPAPVKAVMIDPERRLFFTACEKTITIWNLISLEIEGVLKCHRDEVRAIHSCGDYIFTGGKGTPNGGSLLIWDLRKLNPNQALEEKEKNQDIFAFTSTSSMLYYGTRNHSVRRMGIGSWDVLSPFEPPHLDSVTGLAIVKDKLVSGSKDKHLKLWSLDHAVNNNKQTSHAFNDYVTAVHSPICPPASPIFYAGSKDGQVKTCCIKNDRIEVLGGILAHTQAVNSVCTLDDNPYGLMTASQDKVIKLWQPTRETMDNISCGGLD